MTAETRPPTAPARREAARLLERARAAAADLSARLRRGARALVFVEAAPEAVVLRVHGDRLCTYDAARVLRLAEHLAILVAHEAAHVALGHVARGVALVPQSADAWFVATDFEANCLVRAAVVIPPIGLLLPERAGLPSGWRAERYYRRLTRGPQGEAVHAFTSAPKRRPHLS